MSLSIEFDKKRAISAGMKISEGENLVTFPFTEYSTYVDVLPTSCMVTANPWGSLYAPLINWLDNNQINWRT